MRLLTHNLLTCNAKGVTKGFPLKIEATKVETQTTDYNEAFIKNMIPKIEYEVLRNAAKQLDENISLPDVLTQEMQEDEAILKKIHTALMELVVIEGNLICPESGRKFPIKAGIPNMLLNEDEV